jgi:HIRAN domain
MHHIFSRVTGECFRNDDGTERQAIIVNCRVGAPLLLEAKPNNPGDENVIRVLGEDGQQIGYLERDLAARLVNHLGELSAFAASIHRPKFSPYYGVWLLIVLSEGQSAEVVQGYAREVLADREISPDRSSQPSRQRTSASPIGSTMLLLLLTGMGILGAIIAMIVVHVVEMIVVHVVEW